MLQEAEKESPLTEKAKKALNEGTFLDDETMAKLVINRISKTDCEFNG